MGFFRKSADEITAKVSDYLHPGEQVVAAFDSAVWQHDGSNTVPAYVVVTDSRLVAVQKVVAFGSRKSAGMDLRQIVETGTTGGIVRGMSFATAAGQRLTFTVLPKDAAAVISQAVAASKV